MILSMTYKSRIYSRYIPVDSTQIGMKIAESDYYVASVKHDGHLAESFSTGLLGFRLKKIFNLG